MWTEYFGIVYIQYWEYLVMFFYLVVLYLYFARQKNLRVGTNPEYRYFIGGLFAKVFGGIFFSLIYFYYYHGGDTTAYFFSSVSMVKLMEISPLDFFRVWLGENTIEARSVFTMETGRPYAYLYLDDRQFMVVRLITPFTFICMKSYLITTVMVASVSYAGVWKLYRTMYRYFPRLHRQLAIAVLFMPSSVVWGSAILKDSITFSAFCWFLHALDNVWFRKVDQVSNTIALVICTLLMVWIKPYIFMVLLVASGLWLSYARVARIKNAAIRYVALPVGMVTLAIGLITLLNSLGDTFGRFSLQSALEEIVTTQNDLAHNTEYGTNSFNVGELVPTWSSVLSKFHIATSAALFRPLLTECNNFVMVLSGLENLFVLTLFVRMVLKTRIVFFLSAFTGNPLVITCFVFALLYGFVTGITTPNFGALVRFKIPLLPMFVGGMYIVMFLVDERARLRGRGLTFRFVDYRNGDPHVERDRSGWPLLKHF